MLEQLANLPIRQQATLNTIIRVPMGSTLYGLNLDDQGDHDVMGVCIEPMSGLVGFHEFEQHIYRTAAEREGYHDAPSQPGDIDSVTYGLRKFLRLAMQGNPDVTLLLFVPKEKWLSGTILGSELQGMTPFIVSRQAGRRFLGYLEAQRQRLLGERGQKKTNRPDLEAAHGYDTKYAYHILRLAYQGCELLSTGRISLPMAEPERQFILEVRRGEHPIQDVLTHAGEKERELKDLVTNSPLDERPNERAVEDWMMNVYIEQWQGER